MDVHGAFAVTLQVLVNHRDARDKLGRDPADPCSLTHLGVMRLQMVNETMSEGKLNRWLGYLQGVAVARGLLSLDDVKAINKEYADAVKEE